MPALILVSGVNPFVDKRPDEELTFFGEESFPKITNH